MNRTILMILVIMLVAAGGLFAQLAGQIVLTGTVPEILNITVTPEPIAATLDLTATVNDLKIGTVTEFSNKLAGYTLTLESASAVAAGSAIATFEGVDVSNTDTMAYTIKYGGAAVTLVSGSAVVSDTTTKTAGTGAANDVAISYDGAAAFLYEDSYTDTLTFTIAAK